MLSRFLVLCLFVFVGKLHLSVAQTTYSDAITIEHGLSQGMIFDLCQTRDGFLWVATKDGLNRYDGYNFKVFTHNPFDPYSIAENNGTALFEDSRGWLWVGLDSKGVDVFDPRTVRFHHFSFNFGDNTVSTGTNVVKIEEANDGSIWIIQRGSVLSRIPVPDAWRTGLPDEPDLQARCRPMRIALPSYATTSVSPMSQFFSQLTRLSNGEMLLTSNAAQVAIDPKTFATRRVNENLLRPDIIHAVVIPSDPKQPESNMWLHGADLQTQEHHLQHIREGQAQIFPFDLSETGGDWPRISPGRAGHVLFTANGYLWDIAPGAGIDFSKPDYALGNVISCALYDRTGNLWAGTLGYGLRKIISQHGQFHSGAAGRSLRHIWANDGRYFVKEYFDIHVFDPKTGNIAPNSAFPDAPHRQINLVFQPDGTTWLLALEEDSKPPQLRRYAPGQFARAEKVLTLNASSNLFDPMLLGRAGPIWIATNNCQLARFAIATEQFDYFSYAHLFGEKAKLVRAMALAEDTSGTLWIGTQLGLVKATQKTGGGFDFQLIAADPANPKGLNNNFVVCVLPMPDGQIWLGTKGGGINILNTRTGKVRHITTDEGLLNNVVYGILPGSRAGEFWCSTNRGLAKIVAPADADGRFAITTFTAALGLQDNEFNTYAFCKNQNGELVFGGINGLNRFFPDEVRADTTPPPVFIVNIEINNQKSAIAAPEHLRTLELGHAQNNVSIEFAALDFTDPSKNRYRYRLVGLDPDWVETGNHRFAHFNHLAPGKYELRVQGSNGESAWRDAVPLVLVVNPPWYRSDLAYLCYLLLLAWAGWQAYQFQIRRVKLREQLAFEHRETERVKALEQLKTNFFSNITHEFRTPLTLMIEPLRKILPKIQDPDVLDNVRLAEKNSRQLLGLVNQLLDLAKLESGQMTLDLRRADPLELVRGAYGRFLPLADQRGVRMTLRAPETLPEFDCDTGKVELVLNNLLSNALKFTPADGEVRVSVRENPGSGDSGPRIAIAISDTGIGIPPEEKERIFDRFYQVDGSHTRSREGTGIGLSLSRELAERMGGGIDVESTPGQGSVFTFWLPLSAHMPLSNRILTEPTSVALPPEMEELAGTVVAATPPAGIFVRAANAELPLVLIVEDNADMRGFIRRSIGPEWQVVEASDGEEGVKKAVELLPDLVVSDLMMPRKDGYALCDELKNHELTAHIPIILLTAKSGIESKLGGLRRGADDYLTKPFSTEELLARMENLVEMRRRLRAIFGRKVAALAASPTGNTRETSQEFFSEPDRDFLQKFMLLLEKHLSDETLGVENFAQKMLISRVQLHRKLKALTDRPATDFIRDYRLDRAHAMLQNREGRVGEIALRVGFGNEKYFSTVFKEKFGVSPSQI